MAHLALYRAWRPQTFKDMVGQQHIVQTLQNAIRENRLSHAYLFNGPRGTGKTSAAKILAKAVNCEHGPAPEPCNACSQCERITAGAVMDVVEIDAASNRGVEEIRDIRDKVKYSPTEVRRKVYIIDEVHMLTTEAFNALLKTLEEPPAHVMFILATTEPHKLPATIISRCQRFDFRRVSLEEQAAHMQEVCREEGIVAEEEALRYIARLSDGGMRDALSLLDQIASFTGGHVSLQEAVDATGGLPSAQFARLATAVKERDAAAILQEIDAMMRAGKSPDKCLEQLMIYFRDMLLVQLAPETASGAGKIADPGELRGMADGFSRERLFDIIDLLNRYQGEMRYAAHPQTMFEIALLKLISEEPTARGGAGAAAGGGSVDSSNPIEGSSEIQRLKQQMAQLERRLEAALQAGVGASASDSGTAGSAFGRGGAGGVAGAAVQKTRPAAGMRPRVKLDEFTQAQQQSGTSSVLAKWPQVMEQVRERGRTTHAMLLDGKPVAYANDMLLVAFRNTFHRENTEKPGSISVIEEVMGIVIGTPTRLVTVMQKEWDDALAASFGDGHVAGSTSEEFRLEPEEAEEPGPEPLIDEAIRLFGEQLVKINDD